MSVMDALRKLNDIVDESDPDVDVSFDQLVIELSSVN